METVHSKDDTPIAFDRVGRGPSVILVGGALSDRSAGAPIAGLLSQRFTVITFDRRGRGDSGDAATYAVEREVEDLGALVAEADGAASVFGHSSGAVLALEGAVRGLPITKLALYEPPFIVDDSRPLLPEDYERRLTELISSGRRGDAVELFMTAAVGVPPEMVAQMRNSPMWPAMEALAHTLPYDGAIMGDTMNGNPASMKRWASVTVSTLAMDGGASPEWARNAVRALVEVLPDAQHLTLEGQTHAADPEVVAPALERFFARDRV
ncbi:MAG TPA: alpha/beta hydrolase [Actinomycetota bacterium]|jgi:pimeloyl-ACP methyl ester carboxylesterase